MVTKKAPIWEDEEGIVTNTPRAGETPEQSATRLRHPPLMPGWDYAPATAEELLAREAGRMPLLNERGKTHGDFTANGEIMQATKTLWRAHPGWQNLPPYAREALEMNAHKVGRILCGKWNTKDHWVDIAGYANLVAERCEEK